MRPVAGTFEAGEIITVSNESSPLAPDMFTVEEVATGTSIINAVGRAAATYTIPSDGDYDFRLVIQATNTADTGTNVSFSFVCAVPFGNTGTDTGDDGTDTGDDGTDNGDEVTDTSDDGTDNGDGGATALTPAKQQTNLNKAAVNYMYGNGAKDFRGADRAGALLGNGYGSTDLVRVVAQEEQMRKAAEEAEERAASIRTLRKRVDRLKKKYDRIERESFKWGQYRYELLTNNDLDDGVAIEHANTEMEKYSNILLKTETQIADLQREIKKLETSVVSVRNDVQGVIAPVSARVVNKSNFGSGDPSFFQLARHGDQAGSFFADIGKLLISPTAGPAPSPLADFDMWISGKVSILDDGSGAGRDGHSSTINVGAAMKLTDQFAVSAEVLGRFGELDVNQAQSKTDLSGAGVSVSGVFALTEQVRLSLTGFYEHGWFDTSVAGATGDYEADRLGVSAGVSGTFDASGFVLQPAVSVLYSSTDIGGYTDSNAVVVPGQTIELGTMNAGLTISRPLPGEGGLTSWQPYVTARVHHDFRKENNFTIGPNLIVNDSNTNGEIGGGATFRFNGGANASLGATYYGLFGKGANAINIGLSLGIPLN